MLLHFAACGGVGKKVAAKKIFSSSIKQPSFFVNCGSSSSYYCSWIFMLSCQWDRFKLTTSHMPFSTNSPRLLHICVKSFFI